MNAFGAAPELTSTEKAARYRETYLKSVLGAPDLCLGSYAFTWGYKIEATSTWFGLFLPDGSRLAGVDALQELWSGKPPAVPCPAMTGLAVQGKQQVARGEKVHASVVVDSPKGGAVTIEWALFGEQANYTVQGTGAKATASLAEAIKTNGRPEVIVTMPKSGGDLPPVLLRPRYARRSGRRQSADQGPLTKWSRTTCRVDFSPPGRTKVRPTIDFGVFTQSGPFDCRILHTRLLFSPYGKKSSDRLDLR